MRCSISFNCSSCSCWRSSSSLLSLTDESKRFFTSSSLDFKTFILLTQAWKMDQNGAFYVPQHLCSCTCKCANKCRKFTCEKWKIINSLHISNFLQGRIQIFFLGGDAPLRIGITNNNKPHIFFCRIPVVLESHRSSQGGGGCAPPAPPLDLLLFLYLLVLYIVGLEIPDNRQVSTITIYFCDIFLLQSSKTFLVQCADLHALSYEVQTCICWVLSRWRPLLLIWLYGFTLGFISSILESLVLLKIWLAHSNATYCWILLFLCSNLNLFPANDNGTLKNEISRLEIKTTGKPLWFL